MSQRDRVYTSNSGEVEESIVVVVVRSCSPREYPTAVEKGIIGQFAVILTDGLSVRGMVQAHRVALRISKTKRATEAELLQAHCCFTTLLKSIVTVLY